MSKEKLDFQTEVSQLLNLMIHSLYSNRDIFLRELISNASDACDKLRVEALADDTLYDQNSKMEIQVSFNEKERTISIIDSGVGMSREEVVNNLGTIAKSGTKEFFSKLSGDSAKDSALIGQFGVGFYSAFIVAKKVVVNSRRAGLNETEGVTWESDGKSGFSIQPLNKKNRGTEVILHLREPEDTDEDKPHDDLLSHWKLSEILSKYSDHIAIPIMMKKREWDEKKSSYKELDEWEQINKATALWTRPKKDITREEYETFFKSLTNSDDDPITYSHNRVEGRSEYTQLLFVPQKASFDLYDRQQKHGLKLYIKRVFIMDDAEQLLPNYLRFMKGIVDSNDLPLNISREILQESRDIKSIREGCTKRVLNMLDDLSKKHPDKFLRFWKEFGQCLKEGFGEDLSNKEKLAKIVRYKSSFHHGEEDFVSLDDYVARMKDGQEKIYVITGTSEKAVLSSPHLEIFKKKNIEVLLLTDRVDEWVLNFLTEYNGKAVQSVAKGSLDLDKIKSKDKDENPDNKPGNDNTNRFKTVLEKATKVLGDRTKSVKLSDRLTDSACCLVSEEHDVSGHLERLLKSAGQNVPDRKPILEINPQHPLVEQLALESDAGGGAIIGSDGKNVSDGISEKFSDLVMVLFDQALLAEGGQPIDPALFVKRLNGFLLEGLCKK